MTLEGPRATQDNVRTCFDGDGSFGGPWRLSKEGIGGIKWLAEAETWVLSFAVRQRKAAGSHNC